MKNTRFNVRTTFGFSRNRGLLVAGAIAIGILFFMITIFNGPSAITTKVKAAGSDFRGGATADMLAVALNLNDGARFAVFGGHGLRNHGNSTFRGEIGTEGTVTGIENFTSDLRGGNGQARQNLRDAINIFNQLPCENVSQTDLSGSTFTPGVYCLSSADLSGVMTVNGGSDPNSVFVFRVNGTFNTRNDSTIALADGAKATNVYFVAGGDVNIGSNSDINANLLTTKAITIGDSSTVSGKTLSSDGDVTMTNSVLGAGTGSVEICKTVPAGDAIPANTIFSFNVSGVATAVQVPVNGCSAPFDVPTGNATITEANVANTVVTNISVNPANRVVGTPNLAQRQVQINVPEGGIADQTVVTFTNQTFRTGTIEICKQGLDTGVTGIFQFTVQGVPGQTFSVPTGFCSSPINVVQVTSSTTTFPVNVTELARANFRLETASTLPANRFVSLTLNAGFDANGNPITNTNGGFATVNVVVGSTGANQTIVNFGNRSLPGRIKVCKATADTTAIPIGTSFRFTVTGTGPTSPTQTLPGVATTATVDVPAGPTPGGFCVFVPGTFVVDTPVTVTETGLTPGQTLPGGATFADTRVSLITTSSGPATISLANRTATFPAANTTAEVGFTNFVFRPAVLKVCKVAGAGVTAGTNFTFNLSLVNPLTSLPINTAPFQVPAGSCTIVNGPFPAVEGLPGVGTFNLTTQINVTEAAAPGTTITGVSSPSGSTVVLNGRTGTITLNQSATAGLFNEINITNAATGTTQPPAAGVRFDFDGDGKSDPVIFRPSTGTWWYSASSTGQFTAAQWGISTDVLVPADYDGDGKTDLAVYRNGTWHVFGSSSGYIATQFGLSTDIPVVGDFDGDGKADFVVYRPSTGVWYMQRSRDGFGAVQFGISTDRPVAADYDGDGKMDPAVYRGGVWYILGSTSGFSAFQFGLSTDIPAPADYDGDHKADAAVFRNGDWYLLQSTNGFAAFPFGTGGDVPVPADYDGDGKTDVSVYRPSTNVWHVMRSGQSAAGSGYTSFQFGSSGDELMNY